MFVETNRLKISSGCHHLVTVCRMHSFVFSLLNRLTIYITHSTLKNSIIKLCYPSVKKLRLIWQMKATVKINYAHCLKIGTVLSPHNLFWVFFFNEKCMMQFYTFDFSFKSILKPKHDVLNFNFLKLSKQKNPTYMNYYFIKLRYNLSVVIFSFKSSNYTFSTKLSQQPKSFISSSIFLFKLTVGLFKAEWRTVTRITHKGSAGMFSK